MSNHSSKRVTTYTNQPEDVQKYNIVRFSNFKVKTLSGKKIIMLNEPMEVVFTHVSEKIGKPEDAKVDKEIEEFEIPQPEKAKEPEEDAEMKEIAEAVEKEVVQEDEEMKSPSPSKPQANDKQTPPPQPKAKVEEAPVSSPPPADSPKSEQKAPVVEEKKEEKANVPSKNQTL